MNAKTSSKPKKHLPYWAVLLIGIIVTAVVANLLSILLQIGGFAGWKSLSKPTSQPIHIIYADSNVVWVETNDSNIFELTVNCYRENCFQWLKTTEAIPSTGGGTILSNGTNCASLNKEVFPISFSRKEIECVKVVEFGAEYGSVTYYDLLADGTLGYWDNGNNSISTLFFFVTATFILPFLVAAIISVVYLIKNVIQHIRAASDATDVG